jgi:hypothetical protein
MTIYTNSFPDATLLTGPEGQSGMESPRLAWAARRMGSQVLEFIEPANPRITAFPAAVSVQFLGPVQPAEATLTVDGQSAQKADFADGRATWSLPSLAPGSHLLFAQAVLPDGKVRTAELSVTVALKASATSSPGAATGGTSPQTTAGTPDPQSSGSTSPTPTPSATPGSEDTEGGSMAPVFLLLLLAAIAIGIFLLSTKPARVRVIGPHGEESYVLPKGRTLRIGGSARVEGELIFSDASLSDSIAEVTSTGFGKARVAPNGSLKDGTVEVETDEGGTVTESGEDLLTSVTVTWTSPRGSKEVFSIVKEDSTSKSAQGAEHFGGGAVESDDGGDWRS